MARRRESIVQESSEELRLLEQKHRGSSLSQRIQMLFILREHPSRTLGDVANELGRSEPTIGRWWSSYRHGGVTALLGVGNGVRGRPTRIDSGQQKVLERRLRRGEFSSVGDVRHWLYDEFGVRYSEAGVRKLVNRQQGDKPVATQGSVLNGLSTTVTIPDRFLRFLNSMDVIGNVREWLQQFQIAVTSVFRDVDRVMVAANTHCDLVSPDSYRPDIAISQHHEMGQELDGKLYVSSMGQPGQSASRVLENSRRGGFPFNRYHVPQCFEYYQDQRAYLGMIVLFSEIEGPEISLQTLEMMEGMRGFMTFLMAHLVMRHRYYQPMDSVFYDALEGLSEEAKLGIQQRRIVTNLLMGRSYKEISDILEIAEGTVKKQLNVVYKKTGTRSHIELFAKYFTPRLGIGISIDNLPQ